MANIIITLPRNLWLAIKSGIKSVEVRKSTPKVTLGVSKVYVVEKGTTKVVGCFTLDRVGTCSNAAFAWEWFGKQTFVELEWFNNYLKNCKRGIHAWFIRCVWSFDDTVDLKEYFGVQHNPQSYIYTDKEPFIQMTLVKVLDNKTGKLISPSTYIKLYSEFDLDIQKTI